MTFDPAILRALAVGIDVTSYLRIIEARHSGTPMGMGYGKTRFASPSDSFTILYAAQNLATALAEKVIRDRFQGRRDRVLLQADIEELAVASLSARSPLKLLDFAPAARAGWAFQLMLCAGGRNRPDADLASNSMIRRISTASSTCRASPTPNVSRSTIMLSPPSSIRLAPPKI